MRIQITRDNLLAQLPDGDLPDIIILEGIEVGLTIDPLVKKYPEEYAYLTNGEWMVFKRLLEGPATVKNLATFCNPRQMNHGNIVNVRILSLRKKLKANNARWEIRTRLTHASHRVRGEGTYSIHRI